MKCDNCYTNLNVQPPLNIFKIKAKVNLEKSRLKKPNYTNKTLHYCNECINHIRIETISSNIYIEKNLETTYSSKGTILDYIGVHLWD